MYCEQCGKEIDENSGFCEYCGAAVVPDKKRFDSRAVMMRVGIGAGVILLLAGLVKLWSTTRQSRDNVPPADLLALEGEAEAGAGTDVEAQNQGDSGKTVTIVGKEDSAQGGGLDENPAEAGAGTDGEAQNQEDDGKADASPAKTAQDFSEAAVRRPDLGDFYWFEDYLKDGTLPIGAERFYDASLAEGSWLMELCTYPPGQNTEERWNYESSHYLNAVIGTQGTEASVTLDWYLLWVAGDGESVDQTGDEDTVLSGAWNDGYQGLEAEGSFLVLSIQDFYQTADAQYAIGSMEWISGEHSIVGLVRGPDVVTMSEDDGGEWLEEILTLSKKFSGAPYAELSSVNTDGTVTVFVYEIVEEADGTAHTTTWDWYDIDPDTLTGTNFLGEKVDLNSVR